MFFDNASVAAFLGAAAAFFLVALNDWRRVRTKAKKLLPAMLRQTQSLAISRRTASQVALANLAKKEATNNFVAPFRSDALLRLADEVAGHLLERQQIALNNLAFLMASADKYNEQSLLLARSVRDAIKVDADGGFPGLHRISSLFDELAEAFGQEIYLIDRTDELVGAYLQGALTDKGRSADVDIEKGK